MMNKYSDDERNVLTQLAEYFDSLDGYRRKLHEYQNPKGFLAGFFGTPDYPFAESEPEKPTDIITVEVLPHHLQHITEEDVDLIRLAYHQGILDDKEFRERFIKMMNRRVKQSKPNIVKFFAQRGNSSVRELTKRAKTKDAISSLSKEELQERKNWDEKLIALEKEVIQKS